MFIARSGSNSPQGFIARSQGPQLVAALSEPAAKLEHHRPRDDALALQEERLRAYCARMLESGQGLPRRAGGFPLKKMIARECGFRRGVFYNHPRLQRLLDEFDRKEREQNKEKCRRPVEIIADYLAKLGQAGTPLPSWGGRPNIIQIARQCRIHRNVIARSLEIARLLNGFTSQDRRNTPSQSCRRGARAAITQ
jgi:hypothetical protein